MYFLSCFIPSFLPCLPHCATCYLLPSILPSTPCFLSSHLYITMLPFSIISIRSCFEIKPCSPHHDTFFYHQSDLVSILSHVCHTVLPFAIIHHILFPFQAMFTSPCSCLSDPVFLFTTSCNLLLSYLSHPVSMFTTPCHLLILCVHSVTCICLMAKKIFFLFQIYKKNDFFCKSPIIFNSS